MATPKYKVSKSSAASRKSSNMRLDPPTLCKCTKCGQLILPHRICPKCGYYKGVQYVNPDEE